MPVEYIKPCLRAVSYITRLLNSEAVFLTATMPDFNDLIKKYALNDSSITDLITDRSLFGNFKKGQFINIGKISEEGLLSQASSQPSSLIVVNKRRTAAKLYEMLPAEQVDKKLALGEIEIAPLAFMRGRTLANSFIILDEAQNTTPMQMKMFLTRLGENSRMVVNGDLSQVDLPSGVISGLRDALSTLKNVDNISSVTFSSEDVVRHGLVAKIVKAYEEKSKRTREAAQYENV